MKKTKSIAAIAMAAMVAATMVSTVVAADSYVSTSYASSSSSSSVNKIPTQIYMTHYTSSMIERRIKAQASIDAAAGLLNNIDNVTLGLPALSFDNINLSFAATKYDYLIKANAENGATVLTFNSESALKSGMTKIKTEEQTIMNAALAPYVNYINTIISSGSYTKSVNGESTAEKSARLSNAALLTAIKNMLTYTYTDADLFSGDVTGQVKTYQIAYLSEATIGNSSSQTVVANDEEFTNFPRLIVNGVTQEWNNIHHLDMFNNSNNSWWFALKDGNTLNNDYYWLKGMMIPDFNDTISFDAYAGTEWTQYGAASNSNHNNSTDDTTTGYYYNAAYNYVSSNIYAVTNGYTTYYYPNIAYAKAAIVTNSEYYISNVIASTHTAYAMYFCFTNGSYYSSIGTSISPTTTVLMSDSSVTTPGNTAMSYYFNNGNVYSMDGTLMGTASARGYSNTSTWFCASDGRFYPTAQAGKTGYYVAESNVNTVDMNDPYYQYWTLKLQTLTQDTANEKTDNSSNSNNSSDNSSSTSIKTEIIADNTVFVSAEELAALRASGDEMTIQSRKSSKWLIKGEDVKTPRDINLRVTYGTKNIPDALKAVVKKDIAASSQLTIGENLAWSANASLTIKFNEKRANYIAKLYRYDTASSSLILINTSTIGNSGYVTFNNINHGGDYLITLS